MKKSKILLAVLRSIFLVGGLATGLYLVGQRQNIEERAAPDSTISIVPANQTKAPGDSFSFTVQLATGTNVVTVIDVTIKYNPSAMQVTSLTKGTGVSAFQEIAPPSYDNTTGTITYALYTTGTGLQGSAIEVLSVNATATATATAGTYIIDFDPQTEAAASGEAQNVLKLVNDGSLVIASSGTAPTATPTVGPTPTPGSGGNTNPTATPTPGSGSNTLTTGSRTPTPRAAATPVSLPATGTEWPTILGVGIGIFVLIGSILLAL